MLTAGKLFLNQTEVHISFINYKLKISHLKSAANIFKQNLARSTITI